MLQRNFIGRKEELAELQRLDQQKKACLIVCSGRRRIGKSRLLEEFGKSATLFVEIQGLPPREGQDYQDQLDHFSKELVRQLACPHVNFNDWSAAFHFLAQQTQKGHVVILLDEISWMGSHDPDFAGKLKIAWDLHFKQNSKLRLILCGSVSSWIEKNILNSTDFLGRISLEIFLKELKIDEIGPFFGKRSKQISGLEKIRILSLTGGVPRYLEEIDTTISAEENFRNLCFKKTGFLYNEFVKIFHDIFDRRGGAYLKIIQSLASGPKNISQISSESGLDVNGVLTSYLKDLSLSGFIRKETMWNLFKNKETPRINRYRLVDCYTRFYFKFILPYQNKIEKGLLTEVAIEKLPQFDSFIGLQFEIIVLNNLARIFQLLKIPVASIENAGSYFQTANARQKGCQIDLLIQTKNTLYLCEIKALRKVGPDILGEMENKIKALKRPLTYSIRPILIYLGELEASVYEADLFQSYIGAEELLS